MLLVNKMPNKLKDVYVFDLAGAMVMSITGTKYAALHFEIDVKDMITTIRRTSVFRGKYYVTLTIRILRFHSSEDITGTH